MFRKEHDALGEMNVPSKALYGIYTQRVLGNFPATEQPLPILFIRTYIRVKKVYAKTNHKTTKLKKSLRDSIVKACDMLLSLDDKKLLQHCPISRIQSGGGTSTNMLINEIIANVCAKNLQERPGTYRTINPHDHVNMSQSSNDTFPGTTKLVCLQQMATLDTILAKIETQFDKLANKYKKIAKVGRTHLQDAVVIHLGDEFGAYARTFAKNRDYLKHSYKVLLEVNFGGTATGSLQNIDNNGRKTLIEQLKLEFGLPIKKPRNYFEQNSSSGDICHVAYSLSHLANNTIKICNDLRFLSAGPLAGIAEIKLPEVQPGSSIMPGKINPSIPEAMTMICAQVLGYTKTIETLTQMAQLQLQQFGPGIARAVHDSLQSLSLGYDMLFKKCIKGIKADEKHIQKLLDGSFAYATQYSEKLGYDVVADAVTTALKSGKSLKDILDEK